MNHAETHVLEVAQEVADAAATRNQNFAVALHAGEKGHRAVRVHSCPIDEARDHCNAISDALSYTIKKTGYPAVRIDGGLALVWYR